MLALDLFNTPFERALNEGAVDDLEARRIHHLNTRMLELMSRANDADFKASPEGLAGLKREYQKLKDERDSYYKIREAGIPGNVPVEKIPGKEDLLKGRGRTYYEGQESEAGGIGESETSKNWLSQQMTAAGMPNIVTDAKGRTQQQWIKLVQSKFPTAKILQAKMINGPVFATLPDGRKISWTKVETSNNQTKIDEDDASDAVARNLERKLYSRIFGVDPDELIQRDAIGQQDREYSLAAGTEKRLELKLKADQIKEIKLEKLRNERLEDEENAFRRYEIQAQRRDAMEKIRRTYEHELKMINAEHSNNLEIVKTGNNHEIQKLNMEYAEVEKDRAERRQDREDSRRQQSAQADQPEQPTKPEQSSPGSDRARTKPASSSTPAAEPRPMRDMGRAQEVRPGLGKPDLPRLAKESQKKNSALGEKKLGQLRPSLGTGHDIGRSVKKFRAQRGLDEGQVSDEVDHRGDVDTTANIEVPGVDLANDTFKITYNGKPYQVKIQNFSQEGLGRWQIADYDVDIINANGKNLIDLIDWNNDGNAKTDRQIQMVNTIIAYLDTQQAGDIQLMSWRQAGMNNSTAEDLYQEIQEFYKNDKQQIDKATAWLAQNIEDAEERQVFADFVKNPVSRPARTKYIPKEYLMYVAFSYSREGNTELTPGMNLKPIQLDDPDDEEELHRKVDELLKKVQFKFDAFENKIIELADSYGLGSDPDLGSGFGQREMVWDHKAMTTSSSESNKNRQQILANGILKFRAEAEKYVASFNNTLIKIGLPGITEYSTWSGVLGDQLTDQQIRYFATPEGFANLASGKIDVAKMLDDNVDKQGVQEHGGSMGRSVKKFRAQRGLDEKNTGPLDQKLQRLKVQARRQFPRAHTDDEALVLKLLDKETQDDQANRRTDARQDAELRKNFALDREQDDDIDNLQAQASVKEHGGGIGPRQRWQDLMPEQYNDDEDYEDENDQDTELRSGDYVRDQQDGESGEVFRMQGDPHERRVRILDRDGKGWYIEPSRLTRVDPQDPDIQRYFGKQRVRDMDESGVAEGSKPGEYYIHTVYFKDGTKKRIRVTSDEFDVADYYNKRGQAVDRVDYDFQLHSDTTEGLKSTLAGAALAGAMALGGAGAAQAQSASSGLPNATTIIQQIQSGKIQNQNDLSAALGDNQSIRRFVFKQLQAKAGLPGHGADSVINALGKKSTAVAQQPAKSAGHSGSIIQRPTDNFEGTIKEDQDSSGVERAILNRIMVAHTDLLMKFGPDKVMQAAEEVAYNVGDVDEIGTSDVSAYVAQVKQILGATP